jgi:hypothetical protein
MEKPLLKQFVHFITNCALMLEGLVDKSKSLIDNKSVLTFDCIGVQRIAFRAHFIMYTSEYTTGIMLHVCTSSGVVFLDSIVDAVVMNRTSPHLSSTVVIILLRDYYTYVSFFGANLAVGWSS